VANKINNKEVKIRNKEVAETPQNQFFRGKKIREFVSPLNPPKGEVFILDIKIIIVFLCDFVSLWRRKIFKFVVSLINAIKVPLRGI